MVSGVPMGMTHSMTAMLQNRGVSYADQTIFYIAVYPFTCKWMLEPETKVLS